MLTLRGKVQLVLSCYNSIHNWFFPIFSGDHKQKFYWGHKEVLLPVYKNMADAMKKHSEVDVLISFASLRSAFDSTVEVMQYPQVEKTFRNPKLASYISIYGCIDTWHEGFI